MADVVKVVIEQSDAGLLSRVTAEWALTMNNATAIEFNLALTQAIVDVVRGFAASKAANPTG